MEHDRTVGQDPFKVSQSISASHHWRALRKALAPKPRFPEENLVLKGLQKLMAPAVIGRRIRRTGTQNSEGLWEAGLVQRIQGKQGGKVQAQGVGGGDPGLLPPATNSAALLSTPCLGFFISNVLTPSNVRVKWEGRCFLERSKLTEIKGSVSQVWRSGSTESHLFPGNLQHLCSTGGSALGQMEKPESFVISSQRLSWKKL